jgi:hypothetical protein
MAIALAASPRGGAIFWYLSFPLTSFLGILEPETLPVGLDDVDAVSDAVEKGSREPLVHENFGPLFEGQVRGHDDALALIGATDDFEEQLGSGFAEGDIAELVKDEQIG